MALARDDGDGWRPGHRQCRQSTGEPVHHSPFPRSVHEWLDRDGRPGSGVSVWDPPRLSIHLQIQCRCAPERPHSNGVQLLTRPSSLKQALTGITPTTKGSTQMV